VTLRIAPQPPPKNKIKPSEPCGQKAAYDCAVEIDGNAYSVPWRLIGETVRARGLLQIGKHQGVSSSCRPGANSGCDVA
jgi:Mu transposase-like protein